MAKDFYGRSPMRAFLDEMPIELPDTDALLKELLGAKHNTAIEVQERIACARQIGKSNMYRGMLNDVLAYHYSLPRLSRPETMPETFTAFHTSHVWAYARPVKYRHSDQLFRALHDSPSGIVVWDEAGVIRKEDWHVGVDVGGPDTSVTAEFYDGDWYV